jgi:zinc transporter ZupT
MFECVDPEREPRCDDRLSGGWRAVAAAWVLGAFFVLFFAGAQALASHHGVAPHHVKLAGAVIPQHDSAGAGVGIPCASRLEECAKSAAMLGPEISYGYSLW